jgi:penicillin-binding protein 1C
VLDDTVPPSFADYANPAQTPLRLTGLADGAVLRPVPGAREVSVELVTQGASGSAVWWMLDGQAQGQTPAGSPHTVSFTRNGNYAITVMDTQGRHARIAFTVSGL